MYSFFISFWRVSYPWIAIGDWSRLSPLLAVAANFFLSLDDFRRLAATADKAGRLGLRAKKRFHLLFFELKAFLRRCCPGFCSCSWVDMIKAVSVGWLIGSRPAEGVKLGAHLCSILCRSKTRVWISPLFDEAILQYTISSDTHSFSSFLLFERIYVFSMTKLLKHRATYILIVCNSLTQ